MAGGKDGQAQSKEPCPGPGGRLVSAAGRGWSDSEPPTSAVLSLDPLPTVWPERCPSHCEPEARWVVEELAMA